MRNALATSLALAGLLCATPLLAQQGSPNTTPLGVTRVVLIRILPNEAAAFWQDVRQHLKPIYEEEKRQGHHPGLRLPHKVHGGLGERLGRRAHVDVQELGGAR